MKKLEKITLIDKIGRELQSRMTYTDIDIYLTAYGINCKESGGVSVNSKYVYVKSLLANVSDTIVIQIADELGIAHSGTLSEKRPSSSEALGEATFWKPGYFRLFLSHLATFKAQASGLQSALKKYGISAFVAHEDIEPSKEWQNEIESALQSMDSLVALLMDGFKESNWCDQEVGVAVGRDVLIIPVRKGLDPYGFIGKYQGIQAIGKTIGQVAEEIFKTLVRSTKTRNKVLMAVNSLISQSTKASEAIESLNILSTIEDIPSDIIESLKQQISDNAVLKKDKKFIGELNVVIKKYGLEEILLGQNTGSDIWDDDLPF